MLAAAERRRSTARWNTIACPGGRCSYAPQRIVPLRRRDEAVQQPQQRALARAVGSEHGRERRRARCARSTSRRMRTPLRATSASRHTIGRPERSGASAIPYARPFADVPAPQRSAGARSRSARVPSASASGRSPLLVSSAIVVVITRVTPSMLPPTIMTAPTSADGAPEPGEQRQSPARIACPTAASLQRPKVPAPSDVSCSRYSDHASATIWRDSAAMIGAMRIVCAMTIAVGVNRMPKCSERTGARQQQVDDEPDDDRRQSHHRVEEDRKGAPSREAADRDRGSERRARCTRRSAWP